MKKVELLAPVGNFESLEAAIGCGADAVYLGLDEMNARANIENFNIENIGDVIARAHLFDVKVYVTLNILISDEEMPNVLRMVEKLLQLKVDAFIVQDLGLAYNIKRMFPNAVLHASTQMGICNLEGAELLKRLGYSRVVLARETKLEEIERIHKNCDIEIEFFIQGALCVSYSGNCYISALNAGASGNRGKCKQFCRLPYTMTDGEFKKTGYLLSAKDFCMLEKLEDLAEAGVISFKIEGRARRAGYVATATAVYRNAIDCLSAGKKMTSSETNDNKKNLKKAFNRGNFISGYFGEERIIDSNIQGHRGVLIGKVLDVNYGKRFNVVKLKSGHHISRGDGLKFIQDESEISSIGVNDVKETARGVFEITTTANVRNGCDVHLTLDSQSEENLLKKQRKISVICNFFAKIGEKAILKLVDENKKVEVCVETEEVCQEAKNQPISQSDVVNQLSKGNEVFELSFEKMEIGNVFIRKAELNELRRNAIEKLKAEIVKNYERKNVSIFVKNEVDLTCQNQEKEEQRIYLFSDLKQLDKVSKANCKLVYCPEHYERAKTREICEKLAMGEVYLSLPICADEKDIKLFKQILIDNENLGIYANNYYALNLGLDRKVIVSNNLNVFNSYSVECLHKMKIEDIVVSIEPIEEIKNCGANLYGLVNYKSVEMNLVHCPFKEHLGSVCKDCKFKRGIIYQMQNGKKMELTRIKAINCNFQLRAMESLSMKCGVFFEAKCLF